MIRLKIPKGFQFPGNILVRLLSNIPILVQVERFDHQFNGTEYKGSVETSHVGVRDEASDKGDGDGGAEAVRCGGGGSRQIKLDDVHEVQHHAPHVGHEPDVVQEHHGCKEKLAHISSLSCLRLQILKMKKRNLESITEDEVGRLETSLPLVLHQVVL